LQRFQMILSQLLVWRSWLCFVGLQRFLDLSACMTTLLEMQTMISNANEVWLLYLSPFHSYLPLHVTNFLKQLSLLRLNNVLDVNIYTVDIFSYPCLQFLVLSLLLILFHANLLSSLRHYSIPLLRWIPSFNCFGSL
jgi:hypothetical protein